MTFSVFSFCFNVFCWDKGVGLLIPKLLRFIKLRDFQIESPNILFPLNSQL